MTVNKSVSFSDYGNSRITKAKPKKYTYSAWLEELALRYLDLIEEQKRSSQLSKKE